MLMSAESIVKEDEALSQEALQEQAEAERTERRKKIIRQTWRSVELVMDKRFTEQFYDKLFEEYPATIPMFQGVDMTLQTQKLYDVVRVAVRMMDDLEGLVPILKDLGIRHARAYAVKREHYGAVTECFMEVLREFILEQTPTQTKSDYMIKLEDAWTWVLNLIGTVMADAADEFLQS